MKRHGESAARVFHRLYLPVAAVLLLVASALELAPAKESDRLSNLKPANEVSNLPAEAKKIVDDYRSRLGDKYQYLVDTKHKVVVIHDLKKAVFVYAADSLYKIANFLWKDFFKEKHDYYITVLMPHDQNDLTRKTGRQGTDAGYYRPADKTLTVNIYSGSGSMIHEFTHALHFADQKGLGQSHPLWIIEGFGTLYEEAIPRDEDTVGMVNWRLPRLQQAISQRKCIPIKDFVSDLGGSYFNKDQGLAYAITRYIFYFLQEKKLLTKWYAEYRKNYSSDRSGLKTLEKVYGESISAFEKDWLQFVESLSFPAPTPDTKKYSMGMASEIADGGLFIMKLADGSPVARAGMEVGDLVMKIDGKPIKNQKEMRDLVAKHKVGDKLKFTVKRIDQTKEFTVTLAW